MRGQSGRSLRWSWWLNGVSLVVALVGLLAAGVLMLIGACTSWVVVVIAFLYAVGAIRQVRRAQSAGQPRPRHAPLVGAIVLSVGLLVACTALNLVVLRLLREADVSSVSSANLRGIYQGYRIYAEAHGVYPPSPQDLIAIDIITWKQLVAPCDSTITGPPEGDVPVRSSYVFLPCGAHDALEDRDIIIAFEREAWCRRELRILADRQRWVLFGDGRVEQLDEVEFGVAMRKDESRRRELGLPVGEATSQTRPAG